MPRNNRLKGDGGVFHLTHRCHNRAFLLKFARDRDTYRSMLREHLHQYDVGLLDYCVTSNHVHLLVDAVDRLEISGLMQEVASEFARLGYHEIMGDRQRFRLLDLDRLCWRLRAADLDQVRKNLAVSLAERIARGELKRQARWTESLAVGSRAFVEKVQPFISGRSETEIAETTDNIWTLQEAAVPYGQETGPKNDSKATLRR